MLSRMAAARGSRDTVQERAAAAESRRKDWLEAIVFSSAARDKARRVRAGHSKVCCRRAVADCGSTRQQICCVGESSGGQLEASVFSAAAGGRAKREGLGTEK